MEAAKSTILSYFSPNRLLKNNEKGPKEVENKHVEVKSLKPLTHHSERRSLQTIQPTNKDGSLTRGPLSLKPKTPNNANKIHSSCNIVTVYEDPPVASSTPTKPAKPCSHEECTQTDAADCWCQCHKELSPEEEAHQLMVQEDIPEGYWKEMAESRRGALNETLEENESLHKTVSELKEENRRLSELAEQGEKLAAFLQEVADGDSDEAEDTESGDVTEDCKAEDKVKGEDVSSFDGEAKVNEIDTQPKAEEASKEDKLNSDHENNG